MSLMLRGVFVLLVALGVGERALWYQAGAGNRNPMASLTAGIASIGLTKLGADPSGLLDAAAPGCPATIRIGLAALDGSEDARFGALRAAGGRMLFIYLGRVESHRDSRHAVTAWLIASAETMLGGRRAQPPNKLVLAVLPASCPDLAALNWGRLSQ